MTPFVERWRDHFLLGGTLAGIVLVIIGRPRSYEVRAEACTYPELNDKYLKQQRNRARTTTDMATSTLNSDHQKPGARGPPELYLLGTLAPGTRSSFRDNRLFFHYLSNTTHVTS